MKISMLMGAFTLAATGAAFSQPAQMGNPTATPRVEQREMNQERRIQQGVDSGQLTQREATRLEAEQGRVERAETKAKADGKVTAKERARLRKMQNNTSRNIARQKNDRQRDMNHDGRKDRPHAERRERAERGARAGHR